MDDARKEIMESTYRALCRHGYADLSIQKIAEESEKGKSSIYYHFDGKDELMLEFMDFMMDEIKERFSQLEGYTPERKLDEMIDMVLGAEDEMWEFRKAMIEIQAKSSKDKRFKSKLRELDQLMVRNFSEVLEELGTEKPLQTAETILSCLEGAVTRKVSSGEREEIENLKPNIKRIAKK